MVRAGRGADEISTDDDGAADVVDCGPGRDRVTYFGPADPLDRMIGCERVRVVS